MLRLILVAIVAILVSEINQIYAGPTEAPETTDQDIQEKEWLHFAPAFRTIIMDEGPLEQALMLIFINGCWTQWFDRDDPSGSGDWETLKDLSKENPGKICPKPTGIEVQTLSGQNVPAPAEEAILIWPTLGLICQNKAQKDKKCEDYRVRFHCSAPYCPVCWTKWFDRDDPSGTGDWELLKDLRKENPGQICEKPLNMEVLTTGSPPTAAGNTGQNFYLNNPDKGFVCRNKDQKSGGCHDYKVRFGCPC